jgi:hypothetical protein
MKLFETLKEAKAELAKKNQFTSGHAIYDRRRAKWRTKAQKARITRRYYVATFIEHLNFE